MTQELHYTSVPRGLRPGSVGFCTVAQTPGLPGPLVERLEGLSGYHQVFPPHDPDAALNPVAFSHLRIAVGGRAYSVLSRVCFAGLDYSARSNKYAHHIVLDANERPAGGPAWLLAQPGFLQTSWRGEPRMFPAGRAVPVGDRPPAIALAWGAQVGDPGWAGVLAESFLADPRKPTYLLFEPGMQLLPLFVEALALLPPERRWDVELSTYFTQLLQGTSCPWRGVLADSAEAKNAHRMPGALVIDLRRPSGEARGGDLVQLARTGRSPARKAEEISIVPESSAPAPPSRSIRTQPSAVSESEYSLAASPPRIPTARSVRELEGLDDESPGLPWGKIAAGLAATLLIALGAGFWLGAFDGLRDAVNVGDLIASASQERSKKIEKVEAEKKQTEEQEKAKLDAIAKEEEEDKKLATLEKPKPKQMGGAAPPSLQAEPPPVAAVPEAKPDNQHQAEKSSKEETDPLPKPVDLPRGEQLVWFRELPAVGDSLIQADAPAQDMTIEFSERILPPIEVFQKRIATDRDSRKAASTKDSSELNQIHSADTGRIDLMIPSKSLVAEAEKIATISIGEKRLTFRWDGTGARRSQRVDDVRDAAGAARRQLADLIRDAAIEFNLKGKGTRYVLLRDPKPRTERVSLKAGAGMESSRTRPINIPWAGADLADYEWELVVTDWRIVSALAGEELVTFASMRPKEPSKDVKLTILEEGLSFHLMFAKDKLTARFRSEKDLEAKMAALDTRYGKFNEEIARLQKNASGKQNGDEKGSPQDELKKVMKERADIKRKVSVHRHYQHANQVFLDVGIGLRLSNDKVIEIARIGPRWKQNP